MSTDRKPRGRVQLLVRQPSSPAASDPHAPAEPSVQPNPSTIHPSAAAATHHNKPSPAAPSPFSGWSNSVSGMTMALSFTRPPRVFCRSISFCGAGGKRAGAGPGGERLGAAWQAAPTRCAAADVGGQACRPACRWQAAPALAHNATNRHWLHACRHPPHTPRRPAGSASAGSQCHKPPLAPRVQAPPPTHPAAHPSPHLRMLPLLQAAAAEVLGEPGQGHGVAVKVAGHGVVDVGDVVSGRRGGGKEERNGEREWREEEVRSGARSWARESLEVAQGSQDPLQQRCSLPERRTQSDRLTEGTPEIADECQLN